MSDTLTPNFGLTKPEVGASDDTWGEKTNANWDIVDDKLADASDWNNFTNKPSTFPPDPEAVDDRVAALLVAGTNITITYNDPGNQLTISSTGGGGSSDFIQAGAGAVTRTMQDKARDIVHVKDFGAIADNVTDNKIAIQNAINSLVSTVGGGTVLFGTGVYLISSEITIASGIICLRGSGRSSTLIKTTQASGNVFHVTVPYVEIDSLSLCGPQTAVSTGIGIYAVGSHGSKFSNLSVSDLAYGVFLDNSSNVYVEFNKITNIYSAGIFVVNGGGDYIVNNQIDQHQFGPMYNFSAGFNPWIASHAYGVADVVSANGGWFVCSVAGNSAASGTGPAITAFSFEITDGTAKWYFLSKTDTAGIRLTGVANSDYIISNDLSGPWAIGIFADGSDGNRILDNAFGQNLGTAIQLGVNATNTLIQGNNIVGVYGINAGAVVDTNGTASGTQFVDNYVQGTGRFGVLIQSANFIVTGNTITNVGLTTPSYAIEVVANVNSFVISGNIITANTGMTGPIRVAAGTSDFYNVMNNIVGLSTIVDGGTGTHKAVFGNNSAVSGGGGSGDVVGPAGAVADSIAVYNGATGKIIKDGGKKISDLALASSVTGKADTTYVDTQDNLRVLKSGDTMTGQLNGTVIYGGTNLVSAGAVFAGYGGTNLRYEFGSTTTKYLNYDGTNFNLVGGFLISQTATAGDSSTKVATTAFVASAVSGSGAFFDNHISGLELSAANATTTFAIKVGAAANSTNVAVMRLASAYTKTTAAWAVGSGNGALDTGSMAANTWYHVHLIRRPDTNVVDVLFSLSITAPTLPANYTQFRRIGSMLTNASSQWEGFTQVGETFMWLTPFLDLNISMTTTPTLYGLSVPLGLNVTAIFSGIVNHSSTLINVYFSSPLISTTVNIGMLYVAVAATSAAALFQIITNTSRQIYGQVSSNAATNTIFVNTFGWIDNRGK